MPVRRPCTWALDIQSGSMVHRRRASSQPATASSSADPTDVSPNAAEHRESAGAPAHVSNTPTELGGSWVGALVPASNADLAVLASAEEVTIETQAADRVFRAVIWRPVRHHCAGSQAVPVTAW